MSITIATLIVSLLFRRLVMSNIRHFNSHREELDHDMNWLYLVFLFDAVLHGWLTAAPAAPLLVLVTCACVYEFWNCDAPSKCLCFFTMVGWWLHPDVCHLAVSGGRTGCLTAWICARFMARQMISLRWLWRCLCMMIIYYYFIFFIPRVKK